MNFDAGSELTKVLGVLGNDDSILVNGSRKHDVIRITQSSPIPGVNGVMAASV
jgi:hypothetical protein